MRGYLAVTPSELAQLIDQSEIEIDSAFVQTQQFLAANPGLGEEEAEYILSLLAAEDSLALQDGSAKFSFALAVDFTPDQLGAESDVEVEIKTSCGWVKVKDGAKISIKDGCIKIE